MKALNPIPGLLFTVTVAIFSCNTKQSTVMTDQVNDSSSVAFTEYTKEIGNVSLPAKYWCGLPGIGRSKDELKSFAQFIPKNADGVFGKIKSHRNDFTLIIYAGIGDILYPSLFSYGVDGKVIDSIGLGRGCAGDDRLILSTHSTLEDDLTVTVLDSSRWIHYPDDAGDYVLDSIVVDQKVYKIDNRGHFMKQ